ncbi:MAG: phosphoribosylglycinamide formyltransferase [Lysobacterales bacterium]|jgi:phosphoribosylglycinamide formyltransferase-1|nr:MAG: phosphoribosylglycinamide formyltransferase [Xanthomonadales bacterium]
MSATLSLAVLVSGRGSNLQAIIDACRSGRLRAKILAVLSDRIEAEGLRRAEAAGIPTIALAPRGYPSRRAYDEALFARISSFAPELVVLAGFMRVLSAPVVEAWAGRMINIHPSLLPKYPGLQTHRRAIEAGDREHGASVHFVSAEVDAGPVIARVRVPILPGDDPETLAARLLPREHALLTATLALFAERRLEWRPAGIHLDGCILDRPLELGADDRWLPA